MEAHEVIDQLSYDPETGRFEWLLRKPGRRPGNPGYLCSNGYVTICLNGKSYMAHRLGWAIFYKSWPEGNLDHIDGDRSNNRIKNLRVATAAENVRNTALASNNTSGIKGVSWHKNTSTWRAAIIVEGKTKTLGYFKDIEKAALAYKDAAVKYFGEFANPARASDTRKAFQEGGKYGTR